MQCLPKYPDGQRSVILMLCIVRGQHAFPIVMGMYTARTFCASNFITEYEAALRYPNHVPFRNHSYFLNSKYGKG